MTTFTLYDYFRSSASYRVRIALNLKGVSADKVDISLLDEIQKSSDYLAKNPEGLVPALDVGDAILSQSLAIIEYLEETTPKPPLLPAEPIARAKARGLAYAIACDIHPINNLRILTYLKDKLSIDKSARDEWYRHWITVGFEGVEARLRAQKQPSTFCCGDAPTIADVCLAPQMFNARRFECDLSPFPNLVRIDANCAALPAFSAAAPKPPAA